MSCCKCGREINSAAEDQIIREVFPELLEAGELSELSEQEAVLMERGRGGMSSFRRSGFPVSAARFRQPRTFRRFRRRPTRDTRYPNGTDVLSAAPQDVAWAQSCLAQIIGRWVRSTGRFDSITRRAIRNFQSRQQLTVTGALDQPTIAALRQACGQVEPPLASNAAPPPDDFSEPDSGASPDNMPAPDSSPDQNAPGAQRDSPPEDAPPEQEGAPVGQGGTGVQPKCQSILLIDGFRSGEYTLRPHHYAKLITVTFPSTWPDVEIHGHTDNQGNDDLNQGLSASRAYEAWQWLTLRNRGKSISNNVRIYEHGATQPRASNATETGRSKNRRVEIFVCKSAQPPSPPQVAGVARRFVGMRRA